MRDVETLVRGEKVVVHEGPYVSRVGEFFGLVGVRERTIVVAVPSITAPADLVTIPLESSGRYVTESTHMGRRIGVIVPDPDLTGDPPERE